MDSEFWRDVLNNILGAIGLIFGDGLSDRILVMLERITASSTIIPDPDDYVAFLSAIGAVALILVFPVAIINLIVGLVTRKPDFVRRFFTDIVGTYIIAVFGLTVFSVFAWFVSIYNQLVTEVSRSARNTPDAWFTTISTVWNSLNPVDSAGGFMASQVGAWFLDKELALLNLAILPGVMLLMLAFAFRDSALGRVFLVFSLAVLAATLFSSGGVATYLAIAAWLFSWVPLTLGISETNLLWITFIGAASIPIVLFVFFLAAGTVTKTQIVGSKKKKGEESVEEAKGVKAAQQRIASNPSTQPNYDASASPTMRARAEAMMDRGKAFVGKTQHAYEVAHEKAEQTKRVADTTSNVAGATQKIAVGVAARFATAPYVPYIAGGVAVGAGVVKMAADKTSAAADAALRADQRAREYVSSAYNQSTDQSNQGGDEK